AARDVHPREAERGGALPQAGLDTVVENAGVGPGEETALEAHAAALLDVRHHGDHTAFEAPPVVGVEAAHVDAEIDLTGYLGHGVPFGIGSEFADGEGEVAPARIHLVPELLQPHHQLRRGDDGVAPVAVRHAAAMGI